MTKEMKENEYKREKRPPPLPSLPLPPPPLPPVIPLLTKYLYYYILCYLRGSFLRVQGRSSPRCKWLTNDTLR